MKNNALFSPFPILKLKSEWNMLKTTSWSWIKKVTIRVWLSLQVADKVGSHCSYSFAKERTITFHFIGLTLLLVLAEEGEGTDASSQIPLDDGLPIDFGAIEVVQCLIEHHNAVFTDANETVWRWLTSTGFCIGMGSFFSRWNSKYGRDHHVLSTHYVLHHFWNRLWIRVCKF